MQKCITKWIDIREQKPKEGDIVFFYFEFGGVNIGRFYEHEIEPGIFVNCFITKDLCMCDDVIFWMPCIEEGMVFPYPPMNHYEPI